MQRKKRNATRRKGQRRRLPYPRGIVLGKGGVSTEYLEQKKKVRRVNVKQKKKKKKKP